MTGAAHLRDLARIEDPSGNAIELSLGEDGQIDRVFDTTGRTLEFDYHSVRFGAGPAATPPPYPREL